MFITRISPSEAYRSLQNTVHNIKTNTLDISAKSAAGSIGWEEIDKYINFLSNALSQAQILSGTQGLLSFAQSQHTDVPGYDVVTEYSTVKALGDSVIAWMSTNLPKDVSNYELSFTRDLQGNKQFRQFTTAQTATLRTELQALSASIE